MKTKWNLFVILAMLAMLLGAGATSAQAQTGSLSVDTITIFDAISKLPEEPSLFGHYIEVLIRTTGADEGATCTVDYGDGVVDPDGTWVDVNACRSSYLYEATGTYTITVTVTNSDGVTTASNSVTHTIAYADMYISDVFVSDAAFSNSAEPSFTGQAIVAAGIVPEYPSASSCTVDYGDGSGPEAGNLMVQGWMPGCYGQEHTYATAGTYPITVNVTGFNDTTSTMSLTHKVVTLLLEQLPNQAGAAVAESTYCSTGSYCLAADNFLVPEGKTLTIDSINLWGFYAKDASTYTDNFTVRFYADASGLPGSIIATRSATSTRTATGALLGSRIPEYLFNLALDEPQVLTAGTYWIEITNSGGDLTTGNIFTWEETFYADPGGLSLSKFAVYDQTNGWQAQTGYYLALRLIGSLVTPPVTHNISGTVFNDINGDGVWDTDESGLEGASILLDIPCGSESDISIPVNFDGSYMLMGLPADVCMSLSASHLPSYTNLAYRVTTPAVKFDPLSADQTGVNIGLLEYGLTYSPSFPESLPNGQLNQPYSQTITVSGGVPPYIFIRYGSEGNLPALENGLEVSSIDPTTGVITIFGTPTVAGRYTLDVYIQDANGAEREVQGLFFIKTDATFSLTSSANPVNFGQPVTFSLSATGTVDPYQPNGPVTFKADGAVIPGCDQLILGYDELGNYTNPVQCTTSALTVGTHVITADFTPRSGPYNDATVTLAGGQVVVSTVAADLSLTKTDSKDPVKPGAQLVYTLMVTNVGPNAAQTLTLVDTLDRNTTYVTVSTPRGWTCRYANYAVTCTGNSLASGGSATIKITVTVNKTAKVGKELVNNARVSSATYDPVLTNNTVVQKTMVAK